MWMESKKTLAVDPKVYQKLLAIKKGGETVEAVVARLVDQCSLGVGNGRWHSQCKVVFLGPPASGKSMLIKFFFENKDPRTILSDSLLPTKVTEDTTYDWLDLKVNVVDVGHDDFKRVIAGDLAQHLSNAHEIIYVFDANSWQSQRELIASEIEALVKVKGRIAPDAGITCIAHKRELVERDGIGVVVGECRAMLRDMHASKAPRVEATSLLPDHATDAFRVIRNALIKHSSLLRQALLPGFTRT